MRTQTSITAAVALIVILISGLCSITLPATEFTESPIMNLQVVETRQRHPPYLEFCARQQGECELSAPFRVTLTRSRWILVEQVNTRVNREILFSLDQTQYGEEEYWNYPDSGFGDCEDKALEKRRRLHLRGISRGALRMAVAHHRTHHTPHSLLLLETDIGTYVLDTFTDQVKLWYETPYNFESRETPEGTWERFDQRDWLFADSF
ncbi:MAG: transglutaminase-like cysteine peptidase [Sedimenticola sp.]